MKPSNDAESAFLAIGPGSESWLIEAAASGVARIRTTAAVELTALIAAGEVVITLGSRRPPTSSRRTPWS
ncbi:hypothetical protein ABZ499_31730 [Streptomyces sp. NPDC019990]|uniref:hypothetical protein n=1 Tax=Streptomyces sp. NPDC019990 TaxID=3154693 RepID=UPI0033FAC822